jgi:CheY-like chemotaxis protein
LIDEKTRAGDQDRTMVGGTELYVSESDRCRAPIGDAVAGGAEPRTCLERRPCVLIVDDDPDIREVVGLVLREEGYATLEARNGIQALRILRTLETKPSLVLLDLMMSAMDGWQLRLRLKEDPSLSAIPIVIITAHAGVLGAQQASAARQPVLQKPLDFDELIKVVSAIVRPPRDTTRN